MAYMFPNNFTHSNFRSVVKAENKKLVNNRKAISIFQKQDAPNVKWDDASNEYVVKSIEPGAHLTLKGSSSLPFVVTSEYLWCSALSTLSIPDFLNYEKYNNFFKIVSNASCTTSCFASLMKVILDDFDIMEEPQSVSSLTLRRLDSPSGKLV